MNTTYATMTSARKSIRPRLAVTGLVALAALAFGGITSAATANAQYKGQCAEGLAEGHSAATDCSVNWKAKNGKEYCFSSPAAKTAFLKDARGNIKKADAYSAEHPQS